MESTGSGAVTGESDAADGDVVGLCLLDELAARIDLDAQEVVPVGDVGDVEVLVGEVPGIDVSGADGDAHDEVRASRIGGVARVGVGGGVAGAGGGVGQRRGVVASGVGLM